ncbi:MAG TPA: hypothetical protein VFJ06_12880 [Halococcus sp.]|nr:hypothetical protein [Halococcus sp.]
MTGTVESSEMGISESSIQGRVALCEVAREQSQNLYESHDIHSGDIADVIRYIVTRPVGH